MNQLYCDKEQEVTLEALRSGMWNLELRKHASGCHICADIPVVVEFLQDEAELTEAELTEAESAPPNAAFIWWRAQMASKSTAVARATRPIDFVKSLAYVTTGVMLLWFIFESATARPGLTELSKYPSYLQRLWPQYLNQDSFLAGAGAALASVFLGSLYMIWAEK